MADSDISGQITDGSGNPVANAGVYLWREDLAGAGGIVDETTADSNGNFSFTKHPDADNTQHSWHIAADDPTATLQLQSAYGVTARPFPEFPVSEIQWAAGGNKPADFARFEFADGGAQAESVSEIGFNT